MFSTKSGGLAIMLYHGWFFVHGTWMIQWWVDANWGAYHFARPLRKGSKKGRSLVERMAIPSIFYLLLMYRYIIYIYPMTSQWWYHYWWDDPQFSPYIDISHYWWWNSMCIYIYPSVSFNILDETTICTPMAARHFPISHSLRQFRCRCRWQTLYTALMPSIDPWLDFEA